MPKAGNTGRERPLSPHLGIYKPQVTSVLSITHRFSYIILFLALPIFAFWILSGYQFSQWFNCLNQILMHPLGVMIPVALSFVLIYNVLHGVRHIFWDFAIGFELKTVYRTAFLIIAGSILLTLALWYPIWKGKF